MRPACWWPVTASPDVVPPPVAPFDPAARAEEVSAAIADGLVRAQVHPSEPWRILNYTERAVYTRSWTDTTRACRGLVQHTATGAVVARPWPKFFNHGEPGAALDLAAAVETTDKADGSLGILLPDGSIATRGSFASEQALHASGLYRERYDGRWPRDPDWTYLVEIVYPANRVVVDYGPTDDLVLLGAVRTATGEPAGPLDQPCVGWPGPRTEVFAWRTLADALAATPRPGAEGFVVRHLDGPHAGELVKLKSEEYVRLHKALFGLSERSVWEALSPPPDPVQDDAAIEALLGPLPDELHDWVRGVAARLRAEQAARVAAAAEHAAAVVAGLPSGWVRRDYALAVAREPDRALLFLLLDGRDPVPLVWQDLRPVAGLLPQGQAARDESVA